LPDPSKGGRLPFGRNILAIDVKPMTGLKVGDGFPVVRNPSFKPVNAILESAHPRNMRFGLPVFQLTILPYSN
jgi:hypothetical protein